MTLSVPEDARVARGPRPCARPTARRHRHRPADARPHRRNGSGRTTTTSATRTCRTTSRSGCAARSGRPPEPVRHAPDAQGPGADRLAVPPRRQDEGAEVLRRRALRHVREAARRPAPRLRAHALLRLQAGRVRERRRRLDRLGDDAQRAPRERLPDHRHVAGAQERSRRSGRPRAGCSSRRPTRAAPTSPGRAARRRLRCARRPRAAPALRGGADHRVLGRPAAHGHLPSTRSTCTCRACATCACCSRR